MSSSTFSARTVLLLLVRVAARKLLGTALLATLTVVVTLLA